MNRNKIGQNILIASALPRQNSTARKHVSKNELGVSWPLKQQLRENKSLYRHIPSPQPREKALTPGLRLD